MHDKGREEGQHDHGGSDGCCHERLAGGRPGGLTSTSTTAVPDPDAVRVHKVCKEESSSTGVF